MVSAKLELSAGELKAIAVDVVLLLALVLAVPLAFKRRDPSSSKTFFPLHGFRSGLNLFCKVMKMSRAVAPATRAS